VAPDQPAEPKVVSGDGDRGANRRTYTLLHNSSTDVPEEKGLRQSAAGAPGIGDGQAAP